MSKKRYIAWMLMLVCIIMLTASIVPHHHHREFLCLQHDVTACGCKCTDILHQNSKPADGNHACNVGCVTKFHSVTPDKAQDTVTPDYSFYSLLYALTDITGIPLPPLENKTRQYTLYLDKLHPTCLPHVLGLRAPPCVLA